MKMVSVIVPVCNAGAYLKQCVDSILSQEYGNLEVLLVENGSVDESPRICMEYAGTHGNVHMLRQQKRGAYAARNLGMERASGAYLLFVDADDFLPDEKAVTTLVGALERTRADIAVGNYLRLWEGQQIEANRHGFGDGTDTDSLDFRFQGFFSGGVLAYVWAKLYRRSFLEQHAIRLQPLRYAEDKMFNFECCMWGARYAFAKENVYVYRKTPDSLSAKYRKHFDRTWMAIATRTERVRKQAVKGGSQCYARQGEKYAIKESSKCYARQGEKYADLSAHTVFFAVFFDAKQEYGHSGGRLLAIYRTLTKYAGYPFARKCFWQMAHGTYVREVRQPLWRMMLWGFSMGMTLHFYAPLALMIRLLIGCKIDERLSSTGKKRFGTTRGNTSYHSRPFLNEDK